MDRDFSKQDVDDQIKPKRRNTSGSMYFNQPRATYLHVVHFEFANDLYGNLAGIAGQILGPVDVAEGAVSHLLEQLPSFQAGVLGELAPRLALLLDDLGDVVLVAGPGSAALGGRFGVVSSNIVSLGDAVLVAITRHGREGIRDGLGVVPVLAWDRPSRVRYVSHGLLWWWC